MFAHCSETCVLCVFQIQLGISELQPELPVAGDGTADEHVRNDATGDCDTYVAGHRDCCIHMERQHDQYIKPFGSMLFLGV